VNPSSLAPTAYTLADALAALELPCIEVQLAHEAKARGRSALRRVVDKQFHGKGLDGYVKALEALSKRAPVVKADEATDDADDETADETEAVSAPPRTVKTIGRKPAAPVSTAQAPSKTIGRKPAPPAGAKSLGRGEGPKPGAPATGTITRALVREQLQARLGKKVSPDEFAQWARAQWAAIQRGTPAEHPALEDVLLLLSTSAKASDHVILSYAAKLES
jgi:3-dehydroquinate dehydratase-2